MRWRSEINVSNMWPTCGVGAGLWGWFLGDRRLDIVYSLVAVMRWSREVLQKSQSHIVYINFYKYLFQIEIIFTFFKQCFILPDNFITHTSTNNFANTSTQIYTRAQFFFISVHGIKIQGRRYSRYFIQNNAIFLCFKSIHKINASKLAWYTYFGFSQVLGLLYQVTNVRHWGVPHQAGQALWVITGQHWKKGNNSIF